MGSVSKPSGQGTLAACGEFCCCCQGVWLLLPQVTLLLRVGHSGLWWGSGRGLLLLVTAREDSAPMAGGWASTVGWLGSPSPQWAGRKLVSALEPHSSVSDFPWVSPQDPTRESIPQAQAAASSAGHKLSGVTGTGRVGLVQSPYAHADWRAVFAPGKDGVCGW